MIENMFRQYKITLEWYTWNDGKVPKHHTPQQHNRRAEQYLSNSIYVWEKKKLSINSCFPEYLILLTGWRVRLIADRKSQFNLFACSLARSFLIKKERCELCEYRQAESAARWIEMYRSRQFARSFHFGWIKCVKNMKYGQKVIQQH